MTPTQFRDALPVLWDLPWQVTWFHERGGIGGVAALHNEVAPQPFQISVEYYTPAVGRGECKIIMTVGRHRVYSGRELWPVRSAFEDAKNHLVSLEHFLLRVDHDV